MTPQTVTYTFYHRSDKENTPQPGIRILVFAPMHPKGHPMRTRIIDEQFLETCEDVEFWAYITEPAFEVPGK